MAGLQAAGPRYCPGWKLRKRVHSRLAEDRSSVAEIAPPHWLHGEQLGTASFNIPPDNAAAGEIATLEVKTLREKLPHQSYR